MSDVPPAPADAPVVEAPPAPASAAEFLDRLDAAPEPELAPAAEPPAPAAAEPAPAPAAAAAAAGAEDAPVPEGDTFPRSYVEELRQESAKYRTTAREFTEAFEGYDDDARSAMLGIVRGLVEAPEQAAHRMVEVAKELLGEDFEKAIAEGPRPLTQEDLEREFERREEARRTEEAVQAVIREARDLGYEDETPEAVMLYGLAAKFHGGDIKAADAYLKQLEQVAVDKYLASKQEQAQSYPPVSGGGVTAGNENEIKSFDQAKAGLLELLKQ